MQADRDRLKEAFDKGALLRPSPDRLNFVDLVRAVARLRGVEEFEADPGVDRLCREIGRADHYVFILVDGLGLSLLETLPGKSFLRRAGAVPIQAVFPSTTATAFTTLATGHWPSGHGIVGWWTYLVERRISAVAVRFQGRFTGRSLEHLGLTSNDLYPLASFWPNLRGGSLSILPAGIAHSTFSAYVCGGAPRSGYEEMDEAMDTILDSLSRRSGPSLVFLYLPQVDSLAHRLGPDHEKVRQALLSIEGSIQRLCESLRGKARIIITADHGQVVIPESRRFMLQRLDPLLRRLETYPTGEPNVPLFHVRGGEEERFYEDFQERYGDFFSLLTPLDVEQLGLLGPGDLSAVTKNRIGTFMGIALEPAALFAGPPEESGCHNTGFHSGLTSAEMLVPLIIL